MIEPTFYIRLRDLCSRIPIERIGVYVDTKQHPALILWRDSFTGETCALCSAARETLEFTLARVLSCVREQRVRMAAWNWSWQLQEELERRAAFSRARKAVA